MSDQLDEWGALLKMVQHQSTWVMYAALSVVGQLLLDHKPEHVDWPRVGSTRCGECEVAWPCDTYQIIQEELKRGE